MLYLDTLKVSTIEQTADSVDARGGKGNPALISWDFGKEITLSIEDALFSPKSMNLMFGKEGASLNKETGKKILKTVRFRADGTTLSDCHVLTEAKDSEGKIARRNVYFAATVPTGAPAGSVTWSAGLPSVSLPTIYTEAGATAESTDLTNGALYFAKFEVPVIQSVIEVGNDSFPGTYYITGDTYARNETTGEDEFFQFVVPKAKMQAENTITLEAEGDPSVFNFNMKVLRPEDGVMMKLIQYNFNLGNSDEDEG